MDCVVMIFYRNCILAQVKNKGPGINPGLISNYNQYLI